MGEGKVRWEYTTREASGYGTDHGNGSIDFDDLDALGADGWELVCCTPEWGNTYPTLVFKRLVVDATKGGVG